MQTIDARATAATALEVPVLVIGAGPAGLVTAIGLARHGVRSLVVERHPSTSIFPRATGVSTRSMEIFRGWGLDDDIRRGGGGSCRDRRRSAGSATATWSRVPSGSRTPKRRRGQPARPRR